MNTKYVRSVIVLVLTICICSCIEVRGQKGQILDSLLRNTSLPYFENLYVHTDRNNYRSGDTIYLRGDLFSAVLNRQMLNSRFIYVDLLDNNDEVLHREKIAIDTLNNSFNGYFPLHIDLEKGEYLLRAYSYFMQNLGKEYFFSKKISLSENPYDGAIVLSNNDNFKLESMKQPNSIMIELSLIDKLDIDNTNISVSVIATQQSLPEKNHCNGYKPYNTQEIIEKILSIKDPIYPIELSTILSGYIETIKGKRLPNTKLKIYGDNGQFYFAETDSNGYVICPVEWDYGARYYTRAFNLERKYVYLDEVDVYLRADDVKFEDILSPSTPYPVFDADIDDGRGWTDKKIRYVEERRMGVQHGPFVSVLSYGNDVSKPILSSSSKLSSNSLSNSTYGPVDDELMKRNIKSRRKKNIQRVINGSQVNNVEFVFNGGATRYWNYNAVVSKDKPFEFTFPTAADCRTYTVVVNGVDNEGNPVSGVWSVEN